ncbi:MAG: OPT/YSL family transporter, partial [Anaerotignaceae bacterium]
NSKYASSFKEQFTLRAILIGSIGAVILTCSSMFVALKISSLPWPIMFVALASMFGLKGMGKTNYNEINVTHTAMSAGSMVAGGLAFTIPVIWILNPEAEVNFIKLLVVTLGGVILGLIFTAVLRKHFIEKEQLPYAMGQAAAEVVVIGDEGGKKAYWLFGSMGFAAIFTLLRDAAMKIPAVKFLPSMTKYGSYGGVWFSPMLISVGYIIGPLYIGIWFLGALIGDMGILIGGQVFGFFNGEVASAIKSSLGIGLMVGTGFGIIVKEILPRLKAIFGPMFSKDGKGDSIVAMRWAPIVMVVLAFLFTVVLKMPILTSIIVILGTWLATTMSCQCVGQSAINPMEIFGIIILIIAKALSGVEGTVAFFVAAIVAVAAGLTGDVMNDFRSGAILKTDPKAQWYAEVIGGIIGAVVSVGVLAIILKAYGGSAFGGEMFPSAQAAAVAAMVGGISHMPAFLIGLILATILYLLNLPVMTLGLGVYLPFYLSATAFIGGALRFVLDRKAPKVEENGVGTVVASGLLGGEAVVGVGIALYVALGILMG